MLEIRDIQLAEIKLIQLFVEICEKEHLTYYILHGTLLGAIRHKGYIPWDDDADFGMPRPDFERFSSVIDKYLNSKTDFLKFGKTANYFRYFYRLVDKNKIMKRTGMNREYAENAWIDILPLDGMPSNRVQRLAVQMKLMVLRKLFFLACINNLIFKKETSTKSSLIVYYICRHIPIYKLFSPFKRWKALDRALKKYDYSKSEYILNMVGSYKFKEMFKKDIFGDGALYDFEGMKLVGPQNYDFYLSQIYGDYMIIPPLSKRNKHNVEEYTEK